MPLHGERRRVVAPRDGGQGTGASNRGGRGAGAEAAGTGEPGASIRRSGKLDRTRSRLYRNQFLQENMRLKALAEIYTKHSFAKLWNLIFLVKNLTR